MGFADLSIAYPWDTLTDYVAQADAHPRGRVDLSIGTPVDPTPEIVRAALRAGADAPGYPPTAGTPALREAIAAWYDRRRGVPGLEPSATLPTIGSKELVGLVPSLLGLGPGDVVVHPAAAYPTYEVGARLSGARAIATDRVADWADRDDVRLVWVNSPGNPTGRVAGVEELAEVVAAARRIGAVVICDECYAELAWDEPYATSGVPSLLDPAVCGGSHEGLLSCYSLSKQSSIAGYRAAFVAGDHDLIDRLLAVRKHLGLIVPAPIQAAMTVALGDDEHVAVQRERYRRRRDVLANALVEAGYVIDDSEAGLYLWCRSAQPFSRDGQESAMNTLDIGMDCWSMMSAFAGHGILVGPGEFYGPAGSSHVRVALTATDAAVEEAADRLLGRS